MKTEIYENYDAFVNREDKSINGVSPAFAQANPDWPAERGNNGCWDCFRCSDCSDCSGCFDCFRCSDCSDCFDCGGCSDCSDCSGCGGCSDCSDCSGCFDCSDCSGCFDCSEKIEADYPKIVGIHQAVLQAAAGENALDMGKWHTCVTTHCRAGWVVRLAGEAGEKLEAKTSTLFAAMMIYKASSPIRVAPTQFFVTNEEAMADMRRCAEEEIKLNAQNIE